MFSKILLLVGLAALAAAAMTDLRRRIVPNRLVLVVAVCGAGLRLVSDDPGMIGLALVAALGVLVLLGLLAHRGLIGGGDVKLIAAATLLFPLSDILMLLLSIAIAGGLIGLAYQAMRVTMTGRSKRRVRLVDVDAPTEVEGLLGNERTRIAAGELPYALAVLAGVIFLVLSETIQCSSATSCLL